MEPKGLYMKFIISSNKPYRLICMIVSTVLVAIVYFALGILFIDGINFEGSRSYILSAMVILIVLVVSDMALCIRTDKYVELYKKNKLKLSNSLLKDEEYDHCVQEKDSFQQAQTILTTVSSVVVTGGLGFAGYGDVFSDELSIIMMCFLLCLASFVLLFAIPANKYWSDVFNEMEKIRRKNSRILVVVHET